MLARLPAPANSPTDHLFVGTDRYTYCTLAWDSTTNQIRTQRSYVDVSDPASRQPLMGNRCLIDPSGRFMTLEMYEGLIAVIPIVQLPGKKRGRAPTLPSGPDAPQVGELGELTTARIDELFVRSSTFLHVQSGAPRLALLYEDSQKKVRLSVRELQYTAATMSSSADATFAHIADFAQELDLGASHLIPVPAPLGLFPLPVSILYLCVCSIRSNGNRWLPHYRRDIYQVCRRRQQRAYFPVFGRVDCFCGLGAS